MKFRTLVLTGVAMGIGAPLNAQEIEDIVVTARKREESLQEVPLSITALSEEQLRQRGIQDNYDVALFTPNFNTVKTVGRTLDRPTIRGMANASLGGEPNASYFVDGVFVGGTLTSSISTATTDAIERVEVLRGPQSAQFGRGTFSGAINYVTKKPTDTWQVQSNLKAGTDNDYKAAGWVSGPLIGDWLGGLVSLSYTSYGGEWRNNLDTAVTPPTTSPDPVFTNASYENDLTSTSDFRDMGGETTKDVLVKFMLTPAQATEANFKFSYTEGDDDHWPSLVPPASAGDPPLAQQNCFRTADPDNGVPVDDPGAGPDSPGAFCGTFNPDGYENRVNLPDFEAPLIAVDDYFLNPTGFPLTLDLADGSTVGIRIPEAIKPGTRRKTFRYLFDITQGFGDWGLSFRAAYNKDEFEQVFDIDHTEDRPLSGLFNFVQDSQSDNHSYELRLDSPADARVSGSLGGYYFTGGRDNLVFSVPGPYVVIGQPDNYGRPITATPIFPGNQAIAEFTENVAFFGSLDIDLTETWTLALEGRWAEDTKTIVGGNSQRDPNPPPAPVNPTYQSEDDFRGTDAPFTEVRNEVKTRAFTPRITLRWTPTDEFMAYALVAKGNKPADWNDQYYRYDILLDNDNVPGDPCGLGALQAQQSGSDLVDEEIQWTYEFGVKTSWLDRRLTANLSTFFIDWKNQAIFIVEDIQTVTVDPVQCLTTTIRENAGRSEIFGVELETNFVVNENLFLIANYGFNDGEFKEGTDSNFAALTGTIGDIAGKKIPNSSRHNGVLGMVLTNQLTQALDGFIRADFIFESERWVQAANINKLPERKLLNLRFGVESADWTATLYVRNALDNDTPLAALQFVSLKNLAPNGSSRDFWSLNPQRGRQAGIEFQYRFGQD